MHLRYYCTHMPPVSYALTSRRGVQIYSGPVRSVQSVLKSLMFISKEFLVWFPIVGWRALFEYFHDDVIKCKQFRCHWALVRGIHRSPVNSPLKGQCRGAVIFSLIHAWINGCVNNRDPSDLRRHRDHYDVTVILLSCAGSVSEDLHDYRSVFFKLNWDIYA